MTITIEKSVINRPGLFADKAGEKRQAAQRGLKGIIDIATGRMLRFMSLNVQVRTGRTKGSLNMQPSTRQGDAIAGAVTMGNREYGQYVGHTPGKRSQQFMRYAIDAELPTVERRAGEAIDALLEGL